MRILLYTRSVFTFKWIKSNEKGYYFQNVLESLMEYVMLHGAEVDVDKARQFEELFRKHAQITELSKVSPTILTRHKIRFLLYKYLSICRFYLSLSLSLNQ